MTTPITSPQATEQRRALAVLGRDDILIVVVGVIPPQDDDELYKAGAGAIFGPGTVITQSAGRVLDLLDAKAQAQPAGAP
jgi:methylmalonyl-CoA mutase